MLKFLYALDFNSNSHLKKIWRKVLSTTANVYIYIFGKFYKPKMKELEDFQVIVTLTTFPKRINQCYYCVLTLLRQKKINYKVILYLADSQFECVPLKFKKLLSNRFEIKFCKDYKSYKKILPALEQNTKLDIVTADDDVLYPENWLANIFSYKTKFPNTILCYRGNKIGIKDGAILPYRLWPKVTTSQVPSFDLLPTGVGGVLYPRSFLNELRNDYEIIKNLAPTSDDLWLKTMELIFDYKACLISARSIEWFSVFNSQKNSLFKINVINYNNNDEAIKKLFEYYNIDISKIIS